MLAVSRRVIVAALLAMGLALDPAFAQWQTPTNSIPIGRGAGVTGFNSITPSASGNCLLSTGTGSAPTWGTCGTTVKNFGASGSAQTTTGNIGATSAALTLAAAQDFANGQGILVNHAGAAFSGTIGAPTGLSVSPQNGTLGPGTGTTSYCYAVASADNAGGVGAATAPVCISNGVSNLGAHGAAFNRLFNGVSWANGTNAAYTAVWRNISGGAYCLIALLSANGHGITDLNTPCITTVFWLPTAPPGAALSDWLLTTISAGGGSTALTLGAAAATAVTTAYVQHDDTAAFSAAAAAATVITFPAGTYNITSIQVPDTVQVIAGAGADTTIINGANGADTFYKGYASPMLDWATIRTGSGFKLFAQATVKTVAPSGIGALQLYNSSGAVVRDSRFSGTFGVIAMNTTDASIGPNNVVFNWYGDGFYVASGGNLNRIHNNFVTNMGGEIGGFYANNPTNVGGNLVGIGIENQASHTVVSNNTVSAWGGVFGISNQGAYGEILDNFVECSTHEGIAAAGTLSAHSKISGNYVRWSGASATGNTPGNCVSDDYGMSTADDGSHPLQYVTITDNYLEGSAANGIEIGQGSGTSNPLQYFIVSNNTLQAVAPNSCGIAIEGSNVNNIFVGPNNFINNVSQYNVCEGTSGGTPNNNIVGLQNGQPGSSGTVNLRAASSHYMTRPVLVAGPSSY
jgi:hypothetical protein